MSERQRNAMNNLQEAFQTIKENSQLNSIDIEYLEKVLERSFCVSPSFKSKKFNENNLTKDNLEDKSLQNTLPIDDTERVVINQKLHDSLYAMKQLLSPAKKNKAHADDVVIMKDSMLTKELADALNNLRNFNLEDTNFIKELDNMLQEMEEVEEVSSRELEDNALDDLELDDNKQGATIEYDHQLYEHNNHILSMTQKDPTLIENPEPTPKTSEEAKEEVKQILGDNIEPIEAEQKEAETKAPTEEVAQDSAKSVPSMETQHVVREETLPKSANLDERKKPVKEKKTKRCQIF